jgi:PAS domain S-box-containing protein
LSENQSDEASVGKSHTSKSHVDEALLLRVVKEWSATFDAISDLVSVHDQDFNVVRCNRAFADFIGSEPKELIGKKCYELIHCTSEPIENCPHKAALESGATEVEEVMVGPQDNICLHVTCSPYHDEEGRLVGSAHVARDITSQKKAEDEKSQLLSELQEAMANVNILSGLLPICSYCKQIRDDEGYWNKLESCISTHTHAQFSHGVCPNCISKAREDLGLDKK